jgi:NAD-dependent dihydropyrimidine dehydrogenase PreA subunit
MEVSLEMQVITEKCTGCGVCVETCPNGALQLVDDLAVLEQATCTQCQACIDACPEGAITAVDMPIVVAEPVPMLPARKPQPVMTQPIPIDTKPWLLSALAFAGREILPRLADTLIGALDRRLALAQPVKTQILVQSENAERTTTLDRQRGQRRRYRAGTGRHHRKGYGRGTGKGNGFRNSKGRR